MHVIRLSQSAGNTDTVTYEAYRQPQSIGAAGMRQAAVQKSRVEDKETPCGDRHGPRPGGYMVRQFGQKMSFGRTQVV